MFMQDTGDVLWQFNAGKPIFSSVAYTEYRYVVGCVDGAVYSIGRDGEKVADRKKITIFVV